MRLRIDTLSGKNVLNDYNSAMGKIGFATFAWSPAIFSLQKTSSSLVNCCQREALVIVDKSLKCAWKESRDPLKIVWRPSNAHGKMQI